MQHDQFYSTVDKRLQDGVQRAAPYNREDIRPWREGEITIDDILGELFGFETKMVPHDQSEGDRNPEIEAFLRKVAARITVHPRESAYQPSADLIRFPSIKAFADPRMYYAVLFHELAHWTGHKDRLDRLHQVEDGIEMTRGQYIEEELIAEMTSAYLTAHFGLDVTDRHVAYLREWSRGIVPKRVVDRARVKAKAAFEYLLAKAGLDPVAKAA